MAYVLGQIQREGVQDDVEQAVVQVFAQIMPFNWPEPYMASQQFEQRASGFFIDARGYIMTNAHVVNEAKAIWIQMPAFGQKSFFVDLVGFCPERDLALLVLQDEDRVFIESALGGIPVVSLGDSDILRRTNPVIVLGYPLGQCRVKSSTGVVSGWDSGSGRSFIQITAPVNPGNSGGPLVDVYGQAVGIAVSMILSAQNVGYAIPINELKIVLADLYRGGLVRRASLGLVFNYGSEALAQALGNPVPSGLYVSAVIANSLASTAGISEGDMLYTFNGLAVDAFGDVSAPWFSDRASLYDILARSPIGEPMSMTMYRYGQARDFSFTFDLTDPQPVRQRYPDYEEIDYEVIAGMVIMELTDDHVSLLIEQAPYLLEYVKPEHKASPVLVISHLLPGSLAQLSRTLMPGAIIADINGRQVGTLAALRDALRLSVATGFLTVKTTERIRAAFPFKQVIDDEKRLSEYFGYRLSPVIDGAG